MKIISTILLAGILVGCAHVVETHKDDTVNVAAAIEKPTTITTSQLGSKIRFVPLETSDSSLIGENWVVGFTNDRAIVANFGTEAGALVFDLQSGKFLNRVGRVGQGPEDYSNPFFLTDPATSELYFMSSSGKGYLRFNPDGSYSGRVLPETNVYSTRMMGVGESIAYTGSYGTGDRNREFFVRSMRMDGQPIDSFAVFEGETRGEFLNGFSGITDYKYFRGPLRYSMQTLGQVENQGNVYLLYNLVPMNIGKHVGFKESMCDTVYRLTPNSVVPELIFDMGTHGFAVSDINRRKVMSGDLIVTDVTVTPKKAVFGVTRGWPGEDDHTLYLGTYDRQTGETRITTAAEGIVDDLGGFMPFAPAYSTPNGDLIGILTIEEIEEWYEAHPGFPRPDWLNSLQEDANPILVILSE